MRSRQCSASGLLRSGFTLIEMLVVVVIIGILVSVVGIAVGVLGRDTEVQDQTKKLWAVLSQVKEESELQGRNVGMLVDQTGYEFVLFDARSWSWKQIADDDLLSPRQLPPGLSMTLTLEGRDVVLKPHNERKPNEESDSDSKSNNKAVSDTSNPLDSTDGNAASDTAALDFKKTLQDADMAPQIMVLASGDVNSFDLRIEREDVDHRWHVFSKPDNTIDYGEIDAAP